MCSFLGNHLQGICDTHGQDPAVQDRDGCLESAAHGVVLEHGGNKQAEERAGSILQKSQFERIQLWREPSDQEHVNRPEKSAYEY